MKTQEELEKLASKYADGYSSDEAHASYIAFIDGYTQCQEDMINRKYTEEDIREAIDMARQLSHVSCLEDGEHRLKYSNTEDEIINSLNKQD